MASGCAIILTWPVRSAKGLTPLCVVRGIGNFKGLRSKQNSANSHGKGRALDSSNPHELDDLEPRKTQDVNSFHVCVCCGRQGMTLDVTRTYATLLGLHEFSCLSRKSRTPISIRPMLKCKNVHTCLKKQIQLLQLLQQAFDWLNHLQVYGFFIYFSGAGQWSGIWDPNQKIWAVNRIKSSKKYAHTWLQLY